MRRRGLPVIVVAVGVLVLLTWYVLYTQRVVKQLRVTAAAHGSMFARVQRALQDTTANADPAETLLDLLGLVGADSIPMILTDADGRVTSAANVPFDIAADSSRTRAYVVALDGRNAPIAVFGRNALHYGDSPIVQGLRIIPILQAVAITLLLAFGVYALRERGRADREKVWAGMAREAAHQLGTPLSSLAGWLEMLREKAADPTTHRALQAMEQDLQRLDRVSHRFERIGREPRRDPVDCAALVERMAAYFAARAPTLARRVVITSDRPPGSLIVQADGVLLEWVLEVLVKNAIDALGGRDGHIEVSAAPLAEGGARIRVADDGPGVPRSLRTRIFDAGFSTKESGWGIGLSLARRIVEENHGGKLLLAESDRGAVFDVILRG